MIGASQIWLFKTEPHEFSIDDLHQKHIARWDGIKNYKARNYLRDEVKIGDLVYIYHSSCKEIGLAGLASVASSAYADPAQFDNKSPYFDKKSSPQSPRWFCVDVSFECKFAAVVSLSTLKKNPELQNMLLLKQPRLSVSPVNAAEHCAISKLIKGSRNGLFP